jgi:hypothetical protein
VVTKGLLVRLEAQHDKDEEVERFLTMARPLVQDEPATTAWFAVRFGRHEYGIFDVFPDDSGRQAHLSGACWEACRTWTCSTSWPTNCPAERGRTYTRGKALRGDQLCPPMRLPEPAAT